MSAAIEAFRVVQREARLDAVRAARSCGTLLKASGKRFIACDVEGTLILVAVGADRRRLMGWLPNGLADEGGPAYVEVATAEQIAAVAT